MLKFKVIASETCIRPRVMKDGKLRAVGGERVAAFAREGDAYAWACDLAFRTGWSVGIETLRDGLVSRWRGALGEVV